MNLKMFSENLTNTIKYFIQSIDDKQNNLEVQDIVDTMFELRNTAIDEYALAEKTHNTALQLYLENFLISLNRLELALKKKDKNIAPLIQELINSTKPTAVSTEQLSKTMFTVGAIAVGALAIALGFVAGAGLGLLLGFCFYSFLAITAHTDVLLTSLLAYEIAAYLGGGIVAAVTGKKVYDYFNTKSESLTSSSSKLDNQVQKIGLFFSANTEKLVSMNEEKKTNEQNESVLTSSMI